jgi:hypothetical protein
MKTFKAFNMLNPESEESSESDIEGGEMFTKEYFDRLEK